MIQVEGGVNYNYRSRHTHKMTTDDDCELYITVPRTGRLH
jgi:hypothetical protein